MEDLLSLNSSATKKSVKIKRFDDLENGEYIVKSFKLKDTPYGLRVHVEIDNFYLSLPPRFSDKINSVEQIAQLNAKKFKMIYGGKNAEEFNRLIIDFLPLKDDGADAQNNEEDSALEDDEEAPSKRKRRSAPNSSKKSKF